MYGGMMNYGGGGYGGGYGGGGGQQQSMQMMSSSVSAIMISLVVCVVVGYMMYQNGMFDGDDKKDTSPPSSLQEELEKLRAQNAQLIEGGNSSMQNLAGTNKMFLALTAHGTKVYLTASSKGPVFFMADRTNGGVEKNKEQLWDIQSLPTQLVDSTGKVWPIYRIRSHSDDGQKYLTYKCADATPQDLRIESLKEVNSGEGVQEWLIDSSIGYVLIPRQCHSGNSKNALRSNLNVSEGCTDDPDRSCMAQVGKVTEQDDADAMVRFEQI